MYDKELVHDILSQILDAITLSACPDELYRDRVKGPHACNLSLVKRKFSETRVLK